MIYIDRTSVPIPKELSSARVKMLEEDIVKNLTTKGKFKQKRWKMNPNVFLKIKSSLLKLFNNKCCYCERKMREANLEHFRPISSVLEEPNESLTGYYWLTYKWMNLYLSCETCNMNKGDKFPVIGARLNTPTIEQYNSYDELQNFIYKEENLILDPCKPNEHIDIHFEYDKKGRMLHNTDKAKITIDILELNRLELRNDRDNLIIKFEKEFNNLSSFLMIKEQITDYLTLDKEYLGLRKYLVVDWINSNHSELSKFDPSLPDVLSQIAYPNTSDEVFEKELELKVHELENVSLTSSYDFINPKEIEYLEIKNFKSIKDAKIEISDDSKGSFNDVLLIGQNGVGKSTALQACSLVLLGQDLLDKLDLGNLEKLIRRGARKKEAVISLKLRKEDDPITVRITPDGMTSSRTNQIMPVIGIGSIRRLPEPGEEVEFEDDPSKILSLFRHDVIFPKLEPWLSDPELVDSEQFNEIAKSILDLLLIPDTDIGAKRLLNRRKGHLTINIGDGPEEISELADGYRSVLAYTLYIIRCLHKYWQNTRHAEALIIIDELGNHLHPTWKIRIVSLLRDVFPRCKFIMSTHDPLCLRNAKPGEVHVMSEEPDSKNVVIKQKDVPKGMSLENMLLGDWFFMNYTTDDYTTKLLEEHNEIVYSDNPDQNRIKEIELELDQLLPIPSSGIHTLDDMYTTTMGVIQKEGKKLDDDESLKESLIKRLRDQIKLD